MTAKTTKRRKYYFRDRAEAEDAYRREDTKNTELARALDAALTGRIRYLPQFGPHLVGMFATRYEVHVIARQPQTGACTVAMHADNFCTWIDGRNGTEGAGYYDADLRTAAYHVRRIQARYWSIRPDDPRDIPDVMRDLIREEFPRPIANTNPADLDTDDDNHTAEAA